MHGAGSGPWIFDRWVDELAGLTVQAVDLQENLDVANASMADYRDRVVDAVEAITRPTTLCGWSMGGLVALMATQETEPSTLVLLEPSPPGEVQGFDPEIVTESGTFDPEPVYGRFPVGVGSRAESLVARSERKRGISVPEVRCRTLVISSEEFREDRGEAVAALYGAEHVHFPGLTHWDLVLHQEVLKAVMAFIS